MRRFRAVLVLAALTISIPRPVHPAASTELDDAVWIVSTSKDPQKRLKAVQKMGEIRDARSVPVLIEALHPLTDDPRSDWYVRKACVTSLVRIGEPSVGPLKKALADPSPIVRARILEALARLRAPGILELLAARLRKDPDAAVRIECLAQMRDLGDKAAVPALREAAESDQSRIVRERAASIAAKLASDP